ncbi:MAG: S-adenosylmethionine:tRNA ribosyltransferase-isomerase, partial [Bryobacteraceae bacterium]
LAPGSRSKREWRPLVIAASLPVQRPTDAKLLVADGRGNIRHRLRSEFVYLLRPGDLVVANDAATLPASLSGLHRPSGGSIEVRLAGRRSLASDAIRHFSAVVFGAGNFRVPTEDRPPPPALAPGDKLTLGPLRATVERVLDHPRLISLCFDGSLDEIWEGLARHGRPIQYSHIPAPLFLRDVWTPIAGPPVAFEPPSAGFALDWSVLASMAARGIRFATITHAAGISSTGDPEPDALLPFDELYRIPESTALAIRRARENAERVIAIGTTVVRALEHAAAWDGRLRAGEGVATQRISARSRLRIVDAILSGTHQRGTSHFDLLRAFADDTTLESIERELDSFGYRTHEFGDSVFIERQASFAEGGVFRAGECRAALHLTQLQQC